MKIFVKDIKTGDFLPDQVFAIEEIQQHKTRTGNPYFRLRIQDKTGEIEAKIWHDDFPNCNTRGLEKGSIVKIDADIQEYNGKLQATIKKLNKTDDYDISDLVQSTEKDLDKMYAEMLIYIDSVEDKDLKTLLENIFKDETISLRFKRNPAAEKVHHDFVGGLLEHTLEMLNLAEVMLKFYPEGNRDLIITGVFLHDIGKLDELEVKSATLARTVKGKLIGHIVQGIDFVKNFLPKKFPDDLWMKLEHIIVSHQGLLEYGSPVVPATIEAAIVHVVDYASSHVRQFQKAIKQGEGTEKGFSDYQKWIGTAVYLD